MYTIPEIPILFVIVIYLLFYLEIDAFSQTLMIVCLVNMIVIDWIVLNNTETKQQQNSTVNEATTISVCGVPDADAVAR